MGFRAGAAACGASGMPERRILKYCMQNQGKGHRLAVPVPVMCAPGVGGCTVSRSS
jgi:hypothetical protein